MSLNPNGAPAGYCQAGATAYLIDLAGTYSLAGASAPTIVLAGTYSGAGASAPTLAAGAHIPVTGATSAAVGIVDPAGAHGPAGASAATTDPAGTHIGPGKNAPPADPAGSHSGAGASAPTLAAGNAAAPQYGLDRLFLENTPTIPFNEVLSFNSIQKVENFFGLHSLEAKLAKEFFSGYTGSSAHMLFDRMPLGGGRARIFGANINGKTTLTQLQAINNGTLSLTSEGYNFNASINLASATSFADAARLIQSALNAAQPTEATTTGSSIAPASASFTGSIEGGLMVVTAVSSGQIAIGGVLTSANGYFGHIIAQISGTPGGVGVYNVWYGAPRNRVSAPPGTALSETYGILTVGTVNSGTVAVGQEVTGNGVTGNTAIQHQVKGSGSGAGSQWIVDLTQTVTPEDMAMKAAPLQVNYHHVTGKTEDSDSFWIEVNSFYPVLPTTVSYASETTAADLLGLTQSAGAYLSTPGQFTKSPRAWLNNIVNNENSDWSSFQMTYPTAPDTADELSDWSAASGGRFQYLSGYTTSTPPIVLSSSAAIDPAGTYSGAGASAPTLAAGAAYIPGAGPASAAGDFVDSAAVRNASVSAAGLTAVSPDLTASPDTLNPNGAPAGYYYQAGATAYIEDPAGTYSLAGASAPIADPGGTYSAACASAPTTDPAGTYSSPYALTRLFLEDPQITPLYQVESFNSITAVENFYGVRSPEANLASEFFAGYTNTPAEMLFTRFPYLPARAHLYGANISNMTLSQLQAISGTLTITSQGYNYSGSINLSKVASFAGAATAIKNALNANLPVASTSSGDSITPESVSFTGSISRTDLTVTSVSGGSIAIGSYVYGPGVTAGAQITCQTTGTPGGVGTYGFYVSGGNVSSETLTDSYGVLTVGSVTSGTVAAGQEVTGSNVLPVTAIEGNLSGSGAGSTWTVNNAQTVGNENMTMTGAPLSVSYTSITGATANRDYFEVQQNGNFNFSSSTLSAMGGTAAASLGLSAGSGAFLSSPGQIVSDPTEWMTNFVSSYTSQWSSFQTNPIHPGEQADLTAWTTSTYGQYQYLTNDSNSTPAVWSGTPTTDPAGTYSGPGASAPTPADPGTYIPVTGATSVAAEIVDPAGAYSGPGASAPTLADPGTYIPFTGATSEAAEIVDPAGAYSGAGASAPTLADPGTYIPFTGATSEAVEIVDPAGTYSGAGASAPTLADPGTYIPFTGATSEAVEIADPASTYSGAGASAPTTDPAGTYSSAGASGPTQDPAGTFSPAGASAPLLAAAGTYIPGAGATSSAAELVDPAGTYSGAGASAPTTDPAGTFSSIGASAPSQDPAGTFSPAGASAPLLAAAGTYIPGAGATSSAAELVDPAGTYSGAGASTPTTDPAGSFSLAGASAPTLAQPGYYVPTAGASSETPDDPGYYTPYAGATEELLAQAPVISGTAAGQSTPSGQPDTPFSSVTISDPNIDTSDSLSIQLTGAGGALADGAGFEGLTSSAPGVYLLSGTAAAIMSELDALVFTPSAGSGTTTFTLTDTTSLGTSASDDNTTVTILSGGPPVVSVATFLANQQTLDETQGGFDISDIAAKITANLDELDDPNIDVITISDDGQVGPSVQQLTRDATAIGKLKNVNSSPALLAVLDNAGNIEAGLSTLVADIAEIASITASGGPVVVSTATFTADQPGLDKILGGFAISDTSTDVVQNLGALSADPNITSITASNGPVAVSTATFLAYRSTLNEIAGGFAISDTAANITANLDQLNDPNINSITISGNGQVGSSVLQLTSDATAIGKLTNAGPAPVLLAVSDTAADIEAGLSTLVADAIEIGSIAASNGPVVVSTATFLADQPTLDKIVGGFAISDTAANVVENLGALSADPDITAINASSGPVAVSAPTFLADQPTLDEIAGGFDIYGAAAAITTNLDQLDDSNINSITISDNGEVAASVQQLTSDATAIGKLKNAGSGPVLLAIDDTAADVRAGLSTLVADAGEIGSITASGGPVAVSTATFLADQPALDKIVDGFAISDTAADVAANLNILNGDTNVTSIALTDGGTPTLTLSIQEALNDTHALSEITSLHATALADTAADIDLIASTEASALKADGYTSVASTTGPVAMTITEAETLSGDGIAVTGAPVTASGAVATMTALATTEASTLFGQGYILAVLDTAANIQKLTTMQIAALSARHVTQINASDTSVSLSPTLVAALESTGVKVSAPPGDMVVISGIAANLEALTASEISSLPALGATGLVSTNANVSYTSSQTAAIFSSGLTVSASGAHTVTENFADAAHSVAHFNVTGRTYSSYEDIYNSAATLVGDAQNNVSGSGNLLLYANGLTMTSASGSESVTTGSDMFPITPHSIETTTIQNNHSNETFIYGSGFGQDTIAGFLAPKSAGHDHLQFSLTMFGFSSTATQTADAQALLSSFASGTANTTITDLKGDTLTLNGVTIATLEANLADFKFT